MFLLLILIVLLVSVGYVMKQRQARRRKQALTRQLYAWAGQSPALDPDLQQWIHHLPAAEASVLVELLAGYCASLNWELTWLFAPQIERAPVLKQAIEESVIAYARAILTGLQMEDDVRAYQAYLAFARKPTARKQRLLVQRLYPILQAEGITSVLEPARKRRFLAGFSAKKSEKVGAKPATHKEQVAAIQRAFEQNPARAMEALKQILTVEAENTVALARQQALSTMSLTPVGAVT